MEEDEAADEPKDDNASKGDATPKKSAGDATPKKSAGDATPKKGGGDATPKIGKDKKEEEKEKNNDTVKDKKKKTKKRKAAPIARKKIDYWSNSPGLTQDQKDYESKIWPRHYLENVMNKRIVRFDEIENQKSLELANPGGTNLI